ncbi:hypothetical protein SPONN_592 [uncultured Candidatus Thioglobus sp.]|nr:hypothetical protein SPONN_592 [uncultured Candidatus Thioglobus sp.]
MIIGVRSIYLPLIYYIILEFSIRIIGVFLQGFIMDMLVFACNHKLLFLL